MRSRLASPATPMRAARDDADAPTAVPRRAVPRPPRRDRRAAPTDESRSRRGGRGAAVGSVQLGRGPVHRARGARGRPRDRRSRPSRMGRAPGRSAGRSRRSASTSPRSTSASTAPSTRGAALRVLRRPRRQDRPTQFFAADPGAPGVTALEVLATFRARWPTPRRRFGEVASHRASSSRSRAVGLRHPGGARARPHSLGRRGARSPRRRAASRRRVPAVDAVPLFESPEALDRSRSDPRRPPARPRLPCPCPVTRRSPGGHARLLRLEQGARGSSPRTGRSTGPRASSAGRVARAHGVELTIAFPRSRRRDRPQRRARRTGPSGRVRPGLGRWQVPSVSPSRARSWPSATPTRSSRSGISSSSRPR